MPDKKYSRPRTVRLTEIENIVDDYLKKSGETLSGLIKKSILAYLKNDGPQKEFDRAALALEIKKLRIDLSKVGGNLNQLAYFFNVSDRISEDALSKTHEDLKIKFKSLAQAFQQIEQKILEDE